MGIFRAPAGDIRPRSAIALVIALAASFTLASTGSAHAVDGDEIAPTTQSSDLAATPATDPGTFVSLDPARVLDTRTGNGAAKAAVGAFAGVELQVTGRGGVPASDVSAVVVNVTVTGPSASGFVTVYPSGGSQPTASNLNFTAGQTIPNLVTVKVGAGGRITLTNNSAGQVNLIADVAGYYLAGTPTVAGAFTSLDPARLLDTRSGNGAPAAPVAAWGTVGLQVTGRGGVPETGVSAVVMNVTVTGPTTGGFVTVYPSDKSAPNASNLNFSGGQTIPNLTTVKVGTDGKVNLRNFSAGSVNLIADVAGYYLAGTPTVPGAFVSLDPARLLDTRVGTGTGAAPVGANGWVGLQITDRAGVPPKDVAAVVLNVTATQPSTWGFVTVYPYGTNQPNASNLNFGAGQSIPNLVAVKVGVSGRVELTNNSPGQVDLIADVAGYFLGSPDEPDEVAPVGWIFDECGTDYDGIALIDSPGIVYSPSAPLVFFEGEYYWDYYSGPSGTLVVTGTAESGYSILDFDSPYWAKNEDGSVTGTFTFDTAGC